MMADSMYAVHRRAAGSDTHKMEGNDPSLRLRAERIDAHRKSLDAFALRV